MSDTSPVTVPVTGGQQTSPARQNRWLSIALIGVLLLALAAFVIWWFRPPELHGALLQSPQQASDFSLMTSTGESMSLSDFRGKHVLLYFGYTFCPDVCPTTLNDLAQMLDELGERRAKDVQVLMISVDPERDTAEQLANYLPHFHPAFIGMTGSVEETQAVASQFGIFFAKHDGSAESGYLVDHTSAVTLIDPDGYVRMIFPNATAPVDMAADLRYLMRRG